MEYCMYIPYSSYFTTLSPVQKNLLVPGDKAVAELTEVFSRMMKTPCAISKLEYLLEAVRLTYENVRDSKAPKKSMNDLGADGQCYSYREWCLFSGM